MIIFATASIVLAVANILFIGVTIGGTRGVHMEITAAALRVGFTVSVVCWLFTWLFGRVTNLRQQLRADLAEAGVIQRRAMERRYDEHERRIDALGQRMDSLERRIDAEVADLRAGVGQLGAEIAGLRAGVGQVASLCAGIARTIQKPAPGSRRPRQPRSQERPANGSPPAASAESAPKAGRQLPAPPVPGSNQVIQIDPKETYARGYVDGVRARVNGIGGTVHPFPTSEPGTDAPGGK